jgi:alkanesulfonate monooxygenase SsuD/methylene tetrahydromethanopterin reductase-like flavin-dependent oxidoreductase (luciferase family)
MNLQFGLVSLGDNPPDPHTRRVTSDAQKHQDLAAQAKAAEAAGFALFQVGEHHFNHYQISAPMVVLAAIAQHTNRIRLGTGVSLLATLDPVVVAEEAATLDVLSGGRAEIGVGRGVHEQIFQVMGRKASDATEIVSENLELLHRLLGEENVTWEGKYRPPLNNLTIRPRSVQRPIPIWNGSTSNLDQTARLGLPCIWGAVLYSYKALKPHAERYREAWQATGRNSADFQLGVALHAHVAKTSQAAIDRFRPYYTRYFESSRSIQKSTIPRKIDPGQFSASPLEEVPVCGSPQAIVDKIGHARDLLGLTRVVLSINMAGVPHGVVMEQIEMIGAEVIPAFRESHSTVE